MRLGTLARKISITPSKLTAYLESQSIDLSSGTNTKLTEAQIDLVLEHFNASLDTEPVEESPAEQAEDQNNTPNEEQEEKVEAEPTPSELEELEQITAEKEEEPPEPVEQEEKTSISDSFAEIALPHELEEEPSLLETEPEVESNELKTNEPVEEEEQPYEPKIPADIDPEIESAAERAAYDDSLEVIKPLKVKLPGLKVKGKIDLPEPKTPTETTEEPKKEEKKAYNPDEIITTTGPRRDRRRKPKNYKGKKYDKDYNPVEAARKKKEWEEKKRKEQEERRKKKAKARHYKKTVVPTASAPAASKKKLKRTAVSKKQKQEPSTGNVLQRFWRWMNT